MSVEEASNWTTDHGPGTPHRAGIAHRDEDFRRLGIERERVAGWEDGARTDGRRGTYEWWYFDAHLDDGAKLVVIFMTKDLSAPNTRLSPQMRLNLDLPDGRSYEIIKDFPAASFSASAARADVVLGGNTFAGDLSHYAIHVDVDGITVDLMLDAEVEPWRPHTGYLVFGRKRDLEFAWLPSVPQGRVRGSYEVDGARTEVTGVGYHDHNWGNVGMISVINDWYWARGQAGPYSVIASYITAHKRYGYEPIPIFMLARNGRIVADDAAHVNFSASEIRTDPKTGKPVATVTTYTYDDGTDRYTVTFTRRRDLVANTFVEQMRGWRKAAARLVGFDGAYLRFIGELSIERQATDGYVLETYTDEAIWELMYFGHARQAGTANGSNES
ncbi:hydroxyneurosporene dehydrogenase [Actinotalea sp. BY-33]|uniref:Hydroxyneurosporene dehydrogenase n=1 Tax=Actinotalea soli TaxID=2819234 RepID=A0A939LT13_9CELL|nr:lipocalin-like domain-containing protein [Actinotalea soli]MBO1752495.1 hydroxyneurosporene dehydrogenase [Actinotalea soli]